jgi:hypothetical protein
VNEGTFTPRQERLDPCKFFGIIGAIALTYVESIMPRCPEACMRPSTPCPGEHQTLPLYPRNLLRTPKPDSGLHAPYHMALRSESVKMHKRIGGLRRNSAIRCPSEQSGPIVTWPS